MHISNAFSLATHVTTATPVRQSGNNLPPSTPHIPHTPQILPSIKDLAVSIDPSNMSRNDARAIAEALRREGKLEIDNAFLLESMILVDENGQLRNATETDAIMNEKYNMLDAFKSYIEFNVSKGLPTDALEKGLDFLEKLRSLRENPEINLYV